MPVAVSAPPLGLNVPDVVSCKCCGADARTCGSADFAKSCVDAFAAAPFAPAGIAVPYHRCSRCGFLFTVAFDALTGEEFAEHLYNADYVLADPDFTGARSAHNAAWVAQLLPGAKGRRFLDYGGGNGVFAEQLRGAGFDKARSYDPFYEQGGRRPAGRFEVVTSFEVMEHSTTPEQTLKDIRWFMDDDSILVFTTLLQPEEIEQDPVRWWYAAPRNGHVSLHSKGSLDALMERLGLRWGSFSPSTHIAFRKRLPRFASHLLGGVAGG